MGQRGKASSEGNSFFAGIQSCSTCQNPGFCVVAPGPKATLRRVPVLHLPTPEPCSSKTAQSRCCLHTLSPNVDIIDMLLGALEQVQSHRCPRGVPYYINAENAVQPTSWWSTKDAYVNLRSSTCAEGWGQGPRATRRNLKPQREMILALISVKREVGRSQPCKAPILEAPTKSLVQGLGFSQFLEGAETLATPQGVEVLTWFTWRVGGSGLSEVLGGAGWLGVYPKG